MAQVIQIKRRIPGTGAPAALAAGELATSISAGGVADLYIGDGAAVRDLVSSDRQVELTGAQTITGAKTIALNLLHLPGGDPGDIIQTDGAGNLTWEPLEPGGLLSVNRVAPLTGNGTSGSALGVEMASNAQIATGTDDVYPVDSEGLRSQLGAAASTLSTTQKTVVPAINELHTQLQAVSGAIRLVGTYDVPANEVTAGAGSPIADGAALPASSTANEGWYVIVDVPGTGTGNAPHVPIAAGDWLVSTGTAWVHVPLNIATFAASNVTLTAVDSTGWTTVQAAIQGLFDRIDTAGGVAVEVDGTSILGDGTTGDPLEVGTVDGGTF